MGDPGVGVHRTVGDQGDDSLEIGRHRVPRALDGEFTAMHIRMWQRYGLGGDADEDESAGVRDILHGLRHGLIVTRGVGDQGLHIATGDVLHLFDD